MPQAVYILFGALFTVAASMAAGRLLTRRLELYREEQWGLSLVVGSGILSLMVFALAAAHLLYKGVLLGLGVGLIAWASRVKWSARRFDPLPRWWWLAFALPVTVFVVMGLFHAMAPEMSPDGAAYHLGLVARYYRERGFGRLTTNMYGNLSQGIELLFLFAFAFGKHSAAALVHFAYWLALPWLMVCYGRRFGISLPALAAAGLVMMSPLVGIDGASAYVDVAVACILFAVYYLLQVWDSARAPLLLVPIGILAGFAYGAKYTAFVALPYALGYLLWRRAGWRALAKVALVAALFVLPWMVKNWVMVRNPLSPFFNRLFPNPYVHISFEEDYRRHMRNYEGLPGYRDIPLEVTVHGGALGGVLGPVFLLAPVALLALRRRQGRRLLVAALLFGAVYVTNIGTRFLILPLPFVALAMTVAVARWPALLVLVVWLHAVSSWPDVLATYCAKYAWRFDGVPIRQALRMEPEDPYLERKNPGYSIARLIERRTPPGSRILTGNQVAEAYTTRDILVGYQSGEGGVLLGILWTPVIESFQPTRWLELRVQRREWDGFRVRQTAGTSANHWTVNEVHVLDGRRELERESSWRLTARPNPWGIRDAFDNSPVTRWGSWQALYPGMYMEVRFPAKRTVSGVALEITPDQPDLKLEWEGLASGVWTRTEAQLVERELPPPIGLRREAAEVLRSRGITHLVIHENDHAAQDYHERQEDWGLIFLGETYGYRLYAIR